MHNPFVYQIYTALDRFLDPSLRPIRRLFTHHEWVRFIADFINCWGTVYNDCLKSLCLS